MTCYLLMSIPLLALADPMHVHHDRTSLVWDDRSACLGNLSDHRKRFCAPPAIRSTQIGQAIALLCWVYCGNSAHPGHVFWADDASLRTILTPNAVFTHKPRD